MRRLHPRAPRSTEPQPPLVERAWGALRCAKRRDTPHEDHSLRLAQSLFGVFLDDAYFDPRSSYGGAYSVGL
jgi:hypothetical protein